MDVEALEKKIIGALLHLIGAPEDPQSRYNFMTDPPNLQTMTRLSPSQVTFVTVAQWCARDHPVEFAAFGTWSEELMESMISKDGKGRDDIIKYEQSKRAVPTSSVNILGALKEKATKTSKKIKGEDRE